MKGWIELRKYIIANNWEENYKALGYRVKAYEAVSELTKLLEIDEFFLFKGAALELSVYNESHMLRIFGDIDVAINTQSAYEKIRNSILYNSKTGKFEIMKDILGVYAKLVFDVKYNERLEETMDISDVFSRSNIISIGNLQVRIPSMEDNFLLCIAHDIKHIKNKDPRRHVDSDIDLLLRKVDKEKLFLLAKEHELLDEVSKYVK